MFGKKTEVGHYCPLLKKDCIEHKCAWYIQVRGMNPNTGENMDNWGCSVAWMPFLSIENSQQSRQTGAAVESFRNEVVRANEENKALYINEISKNFGVIPATVTPLTNLLTGEEKTNEH
jgi:hypothetical protein